MKIPNYPAKRHIEQRRIQCFDETSRGRTGNWSGEHESLRSTQSKQIQNRSIWERIERDEQPVTTQQKKTPHRTSLALHRKGKATLGIIIYLLMLKKVQDNKFYDKKN